MRCTELAETPTAFGSGGPVGGLARRVAAQGEFDHPFGHGVGEPWDSRGPGLVAQQPVHPLLHEALLPTPHGGLGLAGAPHDLDGAVAVRGQQHDPRRPDVLLRAVPVHHHRSQLGPVGGTHFDGDPFAHPPDSHTASPRGIRRGTLLSDLIH
jgi:hypothetical protein